MAFEASVFNIMIASPGDVPVERQAVRDVLYEWNAVHADERKQVLLPVGWETHSAPDMSGPPQSIINKQVLDNCDLLVGIFWTRIGTATAEYASGAVEEIERHIAAGKPTMIYFSEAPIKPNLLNGKQYKQLQKFKAYCTPRGLYEGFVGVEDFKNKFRNQLQIMLKTHFKPTVNIDLESIDNLTAKKTKLANALSSDEVMLLKEASKDRQGIIHQVKISAGTYVQTNRIDIIKSQDAREIARWKFALQSLVDKNLVKPVGYKGDVFEVRADGFATVDMI